MREGGQHDQRFVKNKFVKNRVGGRGVNFNLDNVFKCTIFFFFDVTPYTAKKKINENYDVNSGY